MIVVQFDTFGTPPRYRNILHLLPLTLPRSHGLVSFPVETSFDQGQRTSLLCFFLQGRMVLSDVAKEMFFLIVDESFPKVGVRMLLRYLAEKCEMKQSTALHDFFSNSIKYNEPRDKY